MSIRWTQGRSSDTVAWHDGLRRASQRSSIAPPAQTDLATARLMYQNRLMGNQKSEQSVPTTPIPGVDSIGDQRKVFDTLVDREASGDALAGKELNEYTIAVTGRGGKVLEPKQILLNLLGTRNNDQQTLLYTLFQLGTVDRIRLLCFTFLATDVPEVRKRYLQSLVEENRDKHRPLFGLCLRENGRKLSRMQVLDLAEQVTPPESRTGAMEDIEEVLKGTRKSTCSLYTEGWLDPKVAQADQRERQKEHTRDKCIVSRPPAHCP